MLATPRRRVGGVAHAVARWGRAVRVGTACVALVVAVVVGIGTPLTAPPGAAAHTAIGRAVPAPGSTVEPGVDVVEVRFVDPVTEVALDLTRPDGAVAREPVELSADGRTMRSRIASADAAGTYEVHVRFVAADGDAQSDAYTFDVRADGGAGRGVLAVVGVTIVAATVVARVVIRRRNA